MKQVISLILICFLQINVIGATSVNLKQALQDAQKQDKLLLFELLQNENSALTNQQDQLGSFISFSISSADVIGQEITKLYDIKTYPSYVFLNQQGYLLIDPANQLTASAITKVMQLKNDLNTKDNIRNAQGKLSKDELYKFIERRTLLGLDNADLIDQYFNVLGKSDLDAHVLRLFIYKNNVNFKNSFFNFLETQADQVVKNMNISNEELKAQMAIIVENGFQKACVQQNEKQMQEVINYQIVHNPKIDPSIITNEYKTRYFYQTRQALKLAEQASAYVAILEQKKKAGSTTTAEAIQSNEYADRLSKTAQYLVETVSNKSLLTTALQWSLTATKIISCPTNYETTAYILYKLGKRTEAIAQMETAYKMVPSNSPVQSNLLAARLIKMKRGERIF